MDTSFIIVGLIIVAMVLIPYYLFIKAGKSESKIMEAKIKQVIATYNLNISLYEEWGIRYLGIDTLQRKLVFVKSMVLEVVPSEETIQILDIDSIQSCRIVELRKPIKIGDRKEVVLEKLDLEVTLKNGDHLLISFYHMDEDRMEDWELRRIEKWKATLMDLSTKTLDQKRAA